MLKASVIIPTHNRASFLKVGLQSIVEQSTADGSYEIIVVDNASRDNTKDLVMDFAKQSKNLMYLYEESVGLHNARHAGAKVAKGEILIYIDDDVIADKNFVKEILKPYSDPEVSCAGGKILPKWEIEPPTWIKYFPPWDLSLLDDGKELKEIHWIYGCNFSIKKSLLFELGGFNPDAFGGERLWWYRGDGEIGLLRKVHNAGKKVIYNPKAIVWHVIPKNRLTISYFKERAFKSGIEASFSKYRYYNSGKLNLLKLMMRSAVFGVYYITHNVKAKIFVLLKNGSYYKYEASSSYYKARCLYELRLAFDDDLRKFIKKESWLE